jgi:hypothetical protein
MRFACSMTIAAFACTVGPDRIYVTVQEAESDIWVTDVRVER